MNVNAYKIALKAVAITAAISFSFAGFIQPASAGVSAPVVPVPNKTITEASVGIQMFMWNWKSLEAECTNVLGPEGIDWMQISPPQEHIRGGNWWTHYQPVSYKLDSDLGTRAEFTAMVQACNTAGVQVIADVVINHMANTSGEGYAGTNFTKYDYPGLYSSTDFHAGLDPSDSNYCSNDISNYDDAWETTHCELGGLPDLATENPSVQAKIAGYLNDLISIGVAGFRVDAAKHFGAANLAAVRDQLTLVNGEKPYFASEVIGSKETNQPFTSFSDVWAWGYVDDMVSLFATGQTGMGASTTGRWDSFNSSDKTITMVSNHDTEHHGPSALTWADGKKFQLANIFMLADKFGKPMLYSGYAFTSENAGATKESDGGDVQDAICPVKTTVPQPMIADGIYSCMQRWTAIKGMIQWRGAVGSAPHTSRVYNKGLKVLSFKRGNGFIAINASDKPVKRHFKISLPKGQYCDVISGGAQPIAGFKKCVGKKLVVASNGQTFINLPAQGAVAFNALTSALIGLPD